MVTPAEAKVVSDRKIVLRKDGKKMRLKVDSSLKGVRLQVWPGEGNSAYDAPNPGISRVGFVAAVPPGTIGSFKVKLVQ